LYLALQLQKTRVPALMCGVVCVILRLAILLLCTVGLYRFVTDKQTVTGLYDTCIPRWHAIAHSVTR